MKNIWWQNNSWCFGVYVVISFQLHIMLQRSTFCWRQKTWHHIFVDMLSSTTEFSNPCWHQVGPRWFKSLGSLSCLHVISQHLSGLLNVAWTQPSREEYKSRQGWKPWVSAHRESWQGTRSRKSCWIDSSIFKIKNFPNRTWIGSFYFISKTMYIEVNSHSISFYAVQSYEKVMQKS